MILKDILHTLTGLIIFLPPVFAQTLQDSLSERQLQRYHEEPVWINMMGDPNVNYFEACKAFDLYWEGREIPAEAEGEANELYANGKTHEDEKEKHNEIYKKEEHEEVEGLHFKDPATYTMIYEYKRFMNWRLSMREKVDPETGRLLTPQELEAIWKSQTQGIETHIR